MAKRKFRKLVLLGLSEQISRQGILPRNTEKVTVWSTQKPHDPSFLESILLIWWRRYLLLQKKAYSSQKYAVNEPQHSSSLHRKRRMRLLPRRSRAVDNATTCFHHFVSPPLLVARNYLRSCQTRRYPHRCHRAFTLYCSRNDRLCPARFDALLFVWDFYQALLILSIHARRHCATSTLYYGIPWWNKKYSSFDTRICHGLKLKLATEIGLYHAKT